ncbi:hypothetical protein ACFLSY_08540, partial [Bacteroidota bacterium]
EYHKPKKISILLRNNSVISNGMVAWAPKRMELFSMPAQDNLSSDWLEHLVIHEFRHNVQIDKFNQGFTKLLAYFLGQQAAVGVIGVHVPFWFIEGDAVVIETALTKSGRGRDPSFEMELRAGIVEKGAYSYDKAVFGSYKDYIPNHYKLGYYIVANTRKKFGASVWDKTLNYVANKPYKISAFSKGLKKYTAYSKVGLYRSNMNDLKKAWENQDSLTIISNYEILNNSKKYFTNYFNAWYIDNEHFIVEKNGMDDIDRFVKISKNSKEEIIFTPGPLFRGSMTYADNLLVWTEIQPDMRWEHRSWSVLKSFDIKTKKYKQLTKKSRLFSPCLSPTAERIAAVEVDYNNNCSLIIYDVKSMETMSRIDMPQGMFLMTPNWNSNGKNIVAVVQNNKGKCIALIDIKNKTVSYLTDFSFTEISNPVISGNTVLFTSAITGIDNIYLLDINTTEKKQISSSRFGAEYPHFSPDKRKFIWSSFNSMGYNLVESDLNPDLGITIDKLKDNSIKLFSSICSQEKPQYKTSNIDSSVYKIEKYSRLKNLINIHSWAPLAINASHMTIDPGLSIMSQNVLGTMSAEAGWAYNLNEETGRTFLNLSYKGFFPIINIGAGNGLRRVEYEKIDGDTEQIRFREKNLSLTLSQPLNFTSGKYFKGIRPGISYTYSNINYISEKPEEWFDGNIYSLGLSLYAYRQLKKGQRDLIPRWGQALQLNFKNTPFSGNNFGSIFSSEVMLYFPGLIKHHGFRIYAGFQNKKSADYTYIDNISYPRSFSHNSNNSLFTFKADYKLPVFYPDFSIPSIVYCKRIKLGLFNDYAIGTKENEKEYYWSTGIELSSDMYIFRFKVPFDLGIRLSFQPQNDKFNLEILYSVNMYDINNRSSVLSNRF